MAARGVGEFVLLAPRAGKAAGACGASVHPAAHEFTDERDNPTMPSELYRSPRAVCGCGKVGIGHPPCPGCTTRATVVDITPLLPPVPPTPGVFRSYRPWVMVVWVGVLGWWGLVGWWAGKLCGWWG